MNFNIIRLPSNQGHGTARRTALSACSHELVALMDADDISLPNRFEKQLTAFINNPQADIIGGQIAEFTDNPEQPTGIRQVPLEDTTIKNYLKKRCPFNQMSVMFKKSAVERAGGYQDWYCNEDYYLWTRMALKGAVFANVPDTLLYVRTGNAMSIRRGGWNYFKSETALQVYLWANHLIQLPRLIYNVFLRFGGEVVLSSKLRTFAFRYMRSNPTDEAKRSKENTSESVNLDTERFPKFSVAMAVYRKDNPQWFDIALDSVISNTVKPAEIVLVIDGPVPDTIQAVIDKYIAICAGGYPLLRVVKLSQNKGLGYALRLAVERCQHELIARMDSDDIAVEDRFEKQLVFFVKHPEISVCGGQIEEFIDTPSNIIGRRIVPTEDKKLKVYLKTRCPFNHMTVMFRRSDVVAAGNYQDWYCNEDYFLWIRMALANQKFANIPETLVQVRVGNDMYARRGGDKYFQSEIGIQKLMLEKGLISRPVYIVNSIKRFIVQKLLPNSLRAWVFKTLARS